MPKTICFTGHRPNRLGGYDENFETCVWVKEQLKFMVQYAILHDYTKYISSGALGVDTWAAEIIIALRDLDKEPISLLVAVPCANQDSQWPKQSQTRYQNILRKANKVHYVSKEQYQPKLMTQRDKWMVDNSEVVIAVWNGIPSGTGNCVKYALSQNKKVWHINPITRECCWIKLADSILHYKEVTML